MPTIITRGAASALAYGFAYARRTEQLYDTPGTYTWMAPAGVTSVSVVCVGGGGGGGGNSVDTTGGGGGGGGLGYGNNISVTPGNFYTVVVGAAGDTPTNSSFMSVTGFRGSSVSLGSQTGGAGGGYTGDGGGSGGTGGDGTSYGYSGGGGGAGGYSGSGGFGASPGNSGGAGSGGAAGGGGSGSVGGGSPGGGSGGGVGVLGQGSSGAGGTEAPITRNGRGGSGGTNGVGGTGGAYGGGGDGTGGNNGGSGAVRIIWPGTTRQFPSTNTGNL